MTTDQTNQPITEAEAYAFAAKTRAWWDGLTARERALARLAVRADGAGGEDVQGYGEVESALAVLFFYGDGLPLLRLAVDAFYAQTAPPAPSGAGGSGSSFGGRTAMN
jgi:hypothetical protein